MTKSGHLNISYRAMYLCLFVACVLATPTAAWCQIPTSMFDERGYYLPGKYKQKDQLLKDCEGRFSVAAGYVMGVHDAFVWEWSGRAAMTESYTRDRLRKCLEEKRIDLSHECFVPPFCVPLEMSARQLTDLVCKYIKEHPPGDPPASAEDAVLGAFNAAFPCSERAEYMDLVRKELERPQ